jgi:hypothetical protein
MPDSYIGGAFFGRKKTMVGWWVTKVLKKMFSLLVRLFMHIKWFKRLGEIGG